MVEYKYNVKIEWSEDDNCFLASVPEFQYLVVHADTRADALKEVEVVAEEYIKRYKEEGISIPPELDYKLFVNWDC